MVVCPRDQAPLTTRFWALRAYGIWRSQGGVAAPSCGQCPGSYWWKTFAMTFHRPFCVPQRVEVGVRRAVGGELIELGSILRQQSAVGRAGHQGPYEVRGRGLSAIHPQLGLHARARAPPEFAKPSNVVIGGFGRVGHRRPRVCTHRRPPTSPEGTALPVRRDRSPIEPGAPGALPRGHLPDERPT